MPGKGLYANIHARRKAGKKPRKPGLSRRWLFWGLISTVPLLAATWLMIAKPVSGLY